MLYWKRCTRTTWDKGIRLAPIDLILPQPISVDGVPVSVYREDPPRVNDHLEGILVQNDEVGAHSFGHDPAITETQDFGSHLGGCANRLQWGIPAWTIALSSRRSADPGA